MVQLVCNWGRDRRGVCKSVINKDLALNASLVICGVALKSAKQVLLYRKWTNNRNSIDHSAPKNWPHFFVSYFTFKKKKRSEALDLTKITRTKSHISALSPKSWTLGFEELSTDHPTWGRLHQKVATSGKTRFLKKKPVPASSLTSLYNSPSLTGKSVRSLVSLNNTEQKKRKQMNYDTSWSRHDLKANRKEPAHFAAEVWLCYFFGRKYSFFVSIEAKQGTCFFPMALMSRELPTLLMDTFLLTRVSSSVNSREFPYFRSSSHRSWMYQEPLIVSRWE